jgi:hypothetical protein
MNVTQDVRHAVMGQQKMITELVVRSFSLQVDYSMYSVYYHEARVVNFVHTMLKLNLIN